MRKYATILAAVLYQNKVAAQFYQEGDVAKQQADADRKAMLAIQKEQAARATEKDRALKEEQEASLRSQQDPRLADLMKQRSAYDAAVKAGQNPGMSKVDYDKLGKNIGSMQAGQNMGFSQAVQAVEPPKVAPPVSQAPVVPKPQAPISSTVKPPTPPIGG